MTKELSNFLDPETDAGQLEIEFDFDPSLWNCIQQAQLTVRLHSELQTRPVSMILIDWFPPQIEQKVNELSYEENRISISQIISVSDKIQDDHRSIKLKESEDSFQMYETPGWVAFDEKRQQIKEIDIGKIVSSIEIDPSFCFSISAWDGHGNMTEQHYQAIPDSETQTVHLIQAANSQAFNDFMSGLLEQDE